MKKIIIILLSYIFTQDYCPVDEIYNTSNKNELIERRENARTNDNYNTINRDIISIPVIFHNVHRIIDGSSSRSFCDYISGSGENGVYSTDNNQEVCYERAILAYEILNEQFLSANIEFYPHPDYPLMLEVANDPYDHIFTSNFNTIKQDNNIPGTLNIYLDYCIGSNTQNCGTVSGMSTYPWSLESNEPGIAIKHFSFPGMNDLGIAVLPHEIGHYFSLLHINGIWMFNEDFQRELVTGEECEIRGDLICDTPGQPGYGGNNSFFTDIFEGERVCIYKGYGGIYDPVSEILQIGGTDNDIVLGNYTYSNTDEESNFWGTKDLSVDCFNQNLMDQSTFCHVDNYNFLPVATNFQQPIIISQYCGRRGYHEYDEGEGYTEEQFSNIVYSIEFDYTGCKNIFADNYSSNYLVHSDGCIFNGYNACDVNLDGNVNIADIVITINYILGIDDFIELQFNIADINNDLEINISDIVTMINIILG